jgi:hypothetical protein
MDRTPAWDRHSHATLPSRIGIHLLKESFRRSSTTAITQTTARAPWGPLHEQNAGPLQSHCLGASAGRSRGDYVHPDSCPLRPSYTSGLTSVNTSGGHFGLFRHVPEQQCGSVSCIRRKRLVTGGPSIRIRDTARRIDSPSPAVVSEDVNQRSCPRLLEKPEEGE